MLTEACAPTVMTGPAAAAAVVVEVATEVWVAVLGKPEEIRSSSQPSLADVNSCDVTSAHCNQRH